jgi:tRNA uridine 5-carbamoylmethylation protein Kti12
MATFILILFVGLPGSGKSTLCASLFDSLKRQQDETAAGSTVHLIDYDRISDEALASFTDTSVDESNDAPSLIAWRGGRQICLEKLR